MVFQRTKRAALDYQPCHYGESKLDFRGPKAALDQPYVAVIGGSSTYGRFVEAPFPALLTDQLAMPVVNLGVVNAGVDVFVHDPAVIDICHRADVTVVQAVGAQNMSNRLYSVHPRRNDRFTKAATLLQTVFSDVDFTEIHFTRHLLTTLRAVSRDRFRIVEEELKTAWVARMKLLLERIGGDIILFRAQRDGYHGFAELDAPSDAPLLVDDAMIAALEPYVKDTVLHTISANAVAEDIDEMVFDPLDKAAAQEFPNPAAHREMAAALADAVARVVHVKKPA